MSMCFTCQSKSIQTFASFLSVTHDYVGMCCNQKKPGVTKLVVSTKHSHYPWRISGYDLKQLLFMLHQDELHNYTLKENS